MRQTSPPHHQQFSPTYCTHQGTTWKTPALRHAAALTIPSIIGLGACSGTSDSSAGSAGAPETAAEVRSDSQEAWTNDAITTEVAAASDTIAAAELGSPDVEPPIAASPGANGRAGEAPSDASKAASGQPTVDVGEPDPNGSSGAQVWDDRPPEPVPTFPPPTTVAGITASDAGVNPTVDARDDTKSTFSMDVDTGSYTLARTQVTNGQLPAYDSVRTEEFVNYFDQQYRSPEAGKTFAIHVDGTGTPFLRSDTRIVRVGIQGRRIDTADRKPVHLTFVVDNSGSMEEDGKLRSVQAAMTTLLGSLRPGDKVSIVGFSDDAWTLLSPTDATNRAVISDAIMRMAPTDGTNRRQD